MTIAKGNGLHGGEKVGTRTNRRVGNAMGITRTTMVEEGVGSGGTEVASETGTEIGIGKRIDDGTGRTRTRTRTGETRERGSTVLRRTTRSCWTSRCWG
jgi:hypothetical protein